MPKLWDQTDYEPNNNINEDPLACARGFLFAMSYLIASILGGFGWYALYMIFR